MKKLIMIGKSIIPITLAAVVVFALSCFIAGSVRVFDFDSGLRFLMVFFFIFLSWILIMIFSLTEE